MKVIIAGSRTAVEEEVFTAVKEAGFQIDEVVSGCARGADENGEMYASLFGIPVRKFPAYWNKYGRSAGPIRNKKMAEYADALIAVWDGESRGTENMINEASKLGLRVYVHTY